jgi:hypothetical protein
MDAPEGGFAEARGLALGLTAAAVMAPPGAWLLEEAYLKPFAGVRHAHYAAAAALALRGRVAAQPQRIVLATYAEALRYPGNCAPRAAIAAQFSLSWAVAAALAQGDLDPAAYTEAALSDARLRALEARVELVEDAALTACRAARGNAVGGWRDCQHTRRRRRPGPADGRGGGGGEVPAFRWPDARRGWHRARDCGSVRGRSGNQPVRLTLAPGGRFLGALSRLCRDRQSFQKRIRTEGGVPATTRSHAPKARRAALSWGVA